MKAKDWKNTAKLIRERQSHTTTADTSKLSSFSLSELLAIVLQGPYVPLSTSTPVCMPQGNQQTMDSAHNESLFQQVIVNIPQQSLYPSLAALGTSLNTSVSPPIPSSRRVINDIEEQQRKSLKDTVEGTVRWTNTSPTSDLEEQVMGKHKITCQNNTSIYPGGNSATGVFRNKRHQHQTGLYARRPKYRTHTSPKYRGHK